MLAFEVNTNENAAMLKILRDGWVDLYFGVQSRLCLRMISVKVAHHRVEPRHNQRNDETTIVQEMPATYDPLCTCTTWSVICGHLVSHEY